MFDQLFVIHGHRDKSTFPLVYCLTPNRTTATYIRILTALGNICHGLAPKFIMSDFELASINAFAEVYPGAKQRGCFFHFNQCFFKNIQKRPDLFHLYSTDSDFSLKLRHLVALAFVPKDDVLVAFEQLMDDPFFVQHELLLLDFVHYFETTWLGPWNMRHTSRVEPRYKLKLWNCFQSVLDDAPKTNNGCEGFHNAFSGLLGASHPTIYKFIDGLKDKQVLSELKMNQFLAGTTPPQNQKYKDSANKLKEIVEHYATGQWSHVEYLRRLAYCIKP